MARKKIGEYIASYMETFGPEKGYELSRCEFVKEGQVWYLRVFIDRIVDGKYDYMTSDDCEIVSRYLSDCLDRDDPIQQNYYLEVSSPGLDRPLISQKDFDRFAGYAVEIKLYEAVNGSKFLSGELVGLSEGIITIRNDKGDLISLPREKVGKINLAVVF